MIYTVTLNPAIDYVVQLSQGLTPGIINRSTSEEYQFGGKGINVSNVLRTLGQESVVLGFIAGFTGTALEEGLQSAGLTTRFVSVAQGHTRINMKIKGREETEINGSGPVIEDTDMQKLLAQLDTLRPGDVLVLSGSVPGCLPADTYAKFLSQLEGIQIRTVVDAAGDALLCTLPYRPFLVKPNLQELEALSGTALTTHEQIIQRAKQLQQKGARNVLVSLGGDGALLLDETGRVHRAVCPQGTVINSVGAGDSMVAGFLAGYLQTEDYDHALKLGIAAGSATAFSLGLAPKALIKHLYTQA